MTQALYPPVSFWPPEDQLLHYACTGFYGDESQSMWESTTEEVRELAEPREEATESEESVACKVPSSEVLVVAKVPLPPPAPEHPPPPVPPSPRQPPIPTHAPPAQEDLEWATIRATVKAADAVLAAVGTPTASPAEASAATVLETQKADEAIDAGREAEDTHRKRLEAADTTRVQWGREQAQQQAAADADVVAWIEVEAKRPLQVESTRMAAAPPVPRATHDILGSRGSLLPEGCYRGSLLALGQVAAASGMSQVAGQVVGSAEAAAAAALASQQSCTARLPKVLRPKLQPPPAAPLSVGGCPYKQGDRLPTLINVRHHNAPAARHHNAPAEEENATLAGGRLSYESDASVASSDSVYTQT